jgi:hypothetical protein
MCWGTAFLHALSALQHGYDYGQPDFVPFLPEACSGICLGSILNFAFTVLTILQPCAPNTRSTQYKKGQPPRQTMSNVRGYVFGQYGDLKHLPAIDDPAAAAVSSSDMAEVVNRALSSAGALKKCWTDTRAAGGQINSPW